MEKYITPYSTTDIAQESRRALVIAPHCDDEVFGCGANLIKIIKSGGSVCVAVVSQGDDEKVRKSESLCAADIIGYKEIEFLGYRDGYIYEDRDRVGQDIERLIREVRPSLIFIPSLWEMHRDHLACCMASLEALKKCEYEGRVAMYEVGVALMPTHLADVSDVYGQKRAAMECFKSQLQLQNYKEQIEGLNKFRTYTLDRSVEYAEAFWIGDKKNAIELYESKNIEQFFGALQRASKENEELWHLKNSYEERFYGSCEELKGVGEELQRANGELQRANERIDELNNINWLLQNTISWKITKPLRYLSSKIKGERREMIYKLMRSSLISSKVKVKLRDMRNRAFAKYRSFFNSKMNENSNRELLKNRAAYIDMLDGSLDGLLLQKPQLVAIDITVVTYNSAKWLQKYMETLVKQAYPLGLINIYFVDNGSSDETLESLEEIKKRVGELFGEFCIIESQNRGFGHGHNRGAEMGKSEFILISNPDIEFEEDSILNVVSAALRDTKESASWELRQIPYEHPKHYDPVTLECAWSSHACILVRREAFSKIGGYDERIFLYGEDVEFSYRLRSKGWRVKYCPSAAVNHYTYETTNEIKPAQYAGSTIANIYLRLRYGDIYDRLCVLPLIFVGCFREPFEGAKKRFREDLKTKLLPYAFDLIKERREDLIKGITPFRGFDYEFTREGAFYEVRIPKETPLVSIITRTLKGREHLLMQAGCSVFNQTYKNIEWVVVEDGGESAKSSVEKLERIFNGDIAYIACEKIGRSAAGNMGLKNAKGKYVMFLDDDDLLYSDHVEVLIEALEENSDCVAAYSLAWAIESRFEGKKIIENEYLNVKLHHQKFDYARLREMNYIPIQSILFERELFEKRGGFNTEIDHLEDWNLWQRYGYGNKFEYVYKTTSLYRIPMDLEIKASRQGELDRAYKIVKEMTAKEIDAM